MRRMRTLLVAALAAGMLLATSVPALAGDLLRVRVDDDPEVRVRVEPTDTRLRLR